MRSTVIRYTPCMAIFMLVGVISSFGSILHLMYMAVMWRPNVNLYHAGFLFWSGILMQYLQLTLSSAFGLTVADRIFHMLSTKYYSVRLQKLVAYLGLLISIIVLLIICIVSTKAIVPKDNKTNCFTTSCQIFKDPKQLLLNTRGVLSIVNFVLGVIFFFILKIYIARNKELRKKHIQKARRARIKMVAYTIVHETLFQLLPLAIAFISSQAFSLNFSSLFGAYNISLTSLQYGITSVYYYRSFKGLKWRRKPQEIQWAFTTEFPKDRVSTTPGRLRDFLT
ncbi:hypothetical protein FO519_000828 [Halicephalobus sp. NKZ332]|nr:hypothetical protein FO519_000828 [Halicephalobus sp. NKZ332]